MAAGQYPSILSAATGERQWMDCKLERVGSHIIAPDYCYDGAGLDLPRLVLGRWHTSDGPAVQIASSASPRTQSVNNLSQDFAQPAHLSLEALDANFPEQANRQNQTDRCEDEHSRIGSS